MAVVHAGEPYVSEPDGYTADMVITATASATHPADAVLDEGGHPVLDADGNPLTTQEQQ
jgi:hypothetical protein